MGLSRDGFKLCKDRNTFGITEKFHLILLFAFVVSKETQSVCKSRTHAHTHTHTHKHKDTHTHTHTHTHKHTFLTTLYTIRRILMHVVLSKMPVHIYRSVRRHMDTCCFIGSFLPLSW